MTPCAAWRMTFASRELLPLPHTPICAETISAAAAVGDTLALTVPA
jgi:hypothetical protein